MAMIQTGKVVRACRRCNRTLDLGARQSQHTCVHGWVVSINRDFFLHGENALQALEAQQGSVVADPQNGNAL